MRVAAVDLGTNSTRLLVADANGSLEEIVRRLTITRLGEGVDERRKLLPLPIARVRNVLCDYRRELEALGAERTLCIATSAVRDAENGEAFLGEIEWSYGFTTRLLTGEEEAALTLRGIGAVETGTLVVDIGGGSTELQVVGTEVRVSLDFGCVRLTERFGQDVDAVRDHVRAIGSRLRKQAADVVAHGIDVLAEPLGEPHAAEVATHAHLCADDLELGRAAADVDDEGARLVTAPIPTQRQCSLFLTGQQAGREAVAPLDLAEKGLTVLRIAHGARGDAERTLGAERLELAAVVAEDVADACNREGQEPAALVDALAEPRDRQPPDDLLERLRCIGDEQTRRVRPQVDGGDSSLLRNERP